MMTQAPQYDVDFSPPLDDPSWQMWGPYMSNREWGTVRQTEGPEGCNWKKLPYQRAGETAYAYSEDGIFGVCDRECLVCHAFAFWNYKDDHLKERFFGVANGEGVHGEDVKEMYYYRAADPQYRYICAEYLYPQIEYPYRHLISIESAMKQDSRKNSGSSSVALTDLNGWHQDQRYFEIEFEMNKVTPNQLYFQLGITNCHTQAARLVAMPMLFLRNTWSAGGCVDARVKNVIKVGESHLIVCFTDADSDSETQLHYFYDTEAGQPEILLTENSTRQERSGHYKDAFNRYLVHGDGSELVANFGGGRASKAGICHRLKLEPKQQVKLRCFLALHRPGAPPMEVNWKALTDEMDSLRLANLVSTYQSLPTSLIPMEQDILSAAYTNLLWNRQYYPLDRMPHLWQVPGDLPTRLVTVPDKWEQPYLATWDAALHCLCLNCFDRRQALRELMLLLALIRPDGSIFSDEYRPDGVTPPLTVLAAIDVYGKCTSEEKRLLGPRMYRCLRSHLDWWLHRKDASGVRLIDGGVCGVDYVSLFPREFVETGEGLIWALFFAMRFLELSLAIYSTPECTVAASIEQDIPVLIGYLGRLCALFTRDISQENGLFHPNWLDVPEAVSTLAMQNACSDPRTVDDSLNLQVNCDSPSSSGQTSLVSLDSLDGCSSTRSFSLAGNQPTRRRCEWLHAYCYLPVICCSSLPNVTLSSGATLEDMFAAVFSEPADWESRAPYIYADRGRMFITALGTLQLSELLEQLLSEVQFLSQFGIRTMSLLHTCDPATAAVTSSLDPESGKVHHLRQMFCPGAPVSSTYGGNTNWYGSVNLPYNYLVLESLHKWSTVLNGKFDMVEYPSYAGRYRRLKDIVQDLASRNVDLFLPNSSGIIPSTGDDGRRGILLCETFDGDTGRGHGASHKGGWSAIIARILFLMHDISCD